jgi:16S rRNA (uracil1498-N3)-methyltransferase
LSLFNGTGGEYSATLTHASAKAATVHIDGFEDIHNDSPLRITLLQGISRGERMDATIQKATELGVQRIIPVICGRTQGIRAERLEKKNSRWRAIAISACEQSGRTSIPEILPACTLERGMDLSTDTLKLVLDPNSSLKLRNFDCENPEAISILIGPEGGLEQNELALSLQHQFSGIRYGPRILRTETAGPAFIAAVQAIWGDMG